MAVEHFIERADGLVDIVDDEYALAGSEAVGLENVGSLEAAQEVAGLGYIFFSGCEMAGGGYVVTAHKVFGEIFRTLESSTVGTRAYHGHTGAGHCQSLA